MLLPFFNDVVGRCSARSGFWPLTVYFPVEMYIVQKKVPKWSMLWVCLQLLSLGCLVITVAAAAGRDHRRPQDKTGGEPIGA
ncbi:hypothetical protein PR202_ga04717 [Eleusine coracana subsp. coracana]|uniref:Amino acid transporter transmembrane domain-containing protein n=1 Tax=Eleusine coracana subsp. coracana TaxID=191504 RepID=A0AAV5BQL7_ELECO|nr:hypothetical protein PR202_ga04717 [Eleusine coracana subsp. coracana]